MDYKLFQKHRSQMFMLAMVVLFEYSKMDESGHNSPFICTTFMGNSLGTRLILPLWAYVSF